MVQTAFAPDGSAIVVAGSPAIVGLALVEADGETPQSLAGRRFSYSVWIPKTGDVLGDYTADGEDAVVEDGLTVIKMGPTGAETAGWDLSRPRTVVNWAVYELTDDGPIEWVGPALYTVTAARDSDQDFPADPGPGTSAPYAVVTVRGAAGSHTVVVSAKGAPGSPADNAAIARQSIRNALIFG